MSSESPRVFLDASDAAAFQVPPPNLAADGVRLVFEGILPGDRRLGLVPTYHFRIVTEGSTEAGHINLRIGSTEHVRLYAGNVGYEVRPEMRGHRLALRACRALAPFARSVMPLAILTADPDNLASVRTIELLGARFLDEIDVPSNDSQYGRGSQRKRRYEWTP